MARLKRELILFVALFIFLSLGMHMKQWLAHPLEHLAHLPQSQFGTFHPLFFTFLVYAVLAILRYVLSIILRLFSKKD